MKRARFCFKLFLLPIRVELKHDMTLAAVGILVSAHWRLTNANMQDDLVVALWASPDVVSFRYWLVKHRSSSCLGIVG